MFTTSFVVSLILAAHINCPDADCDGVCNSTEDANGNGVFEPHLGETNPLDADTDDDGLDDGEELWLIANYNLMIDPNVFDSDGDGLGDGQEMGKDLSNINMGCNGHPGTNLTPGIGLEVFIPDADTTSTTSPDHADTDGRGLLDGIEDANLNGMYEPMLGETDPNHTGDDNPNFQVSPIVSPGTMTIFVQNQTPNWVCIPVYSINGEGTDVTPAPMLGVDFDIRKPLTPMASFVVWPSGSASKNYTVPPGIAPGNKVWLQGFFQDPQGLGSSYVSAEPVAYIVTE